MEALARDRASWTPERIRAAAAAWVWLPEDAENVETADYQVIAYPGWHAYPTQVVRCRSARPADDLIREVADRVRRRGRDRVAWWIAAGTRPDDLGSRLRALGAELAQTVDVLAVDLTGGLPDVGDTGGVRCVLADDEPTMRAAYDLSCQVFGGAPPPGEAIARELADRSARRQFRVVGYVDAEPAATGGCTPVGEVALLWGAATRPEMRGRGAYRAVLRDRLAVARAGGATLGLVKGRVETSGPILRRLGFRAYGQEHLYVLTVG